MRISPCTNAPQWRRSRLHEALDEYRCPDDGFNRAWERFFGGKSPYRAEMEANVERQNWINTPPAYRV